MVENSTKTNPMLNGLIKTITTLKRAAAKWPTILSFFPVFPPAISMATFFPSTLASNCQRLVLGIPTST